MEVRIAFECPYCGFPTALYVDFYEQDTPVRKIVDCDNQGCKRPCVVAATAHVATTVYRLEVEQRLGHHQKEAS